MSADAESPREGGGAIPVKCQQHGCLNNNETNRQANVGPQP